MHHRRLEKDIRELKAYYTRDEQVLAACLNQLVEIFDSEGLPGIFRFSHGFLWNCKSGAAGYQRLPPVLPWLPKQAFFELAITMKIFNGIV
ncbi:MAG: hypothetical protein ABI813_05860 [Bacteroidota bacterium]